MGTVVNREEVSTLYRISPLHPIIIVIPKK